MSTDAIGNVVLELEDPLRRLAKMLARDEVESILHDALDDVYEDDDA